MRAKMQTLDWTTFFCVSLQLKTPLAAFTESLSVETGSVLITSLPAMESLTAKTSQMRKCNTVVSDFVSLGLVSVHITDRVNLNLHNI